MFLDCPTIENFVKREHIDQPIDRETAAYNFMCIPTTDLKGVMTQLESPNHAESCACNGLCLCVL